MEDEKGKVSSPWEQLLEDKELWNEIDKIHKASLETPSPFLSWFDPPEEHQIYQEIEDFWYERVNAPSHHWTIKGGKK